MAAIHLTNSNMNTNAATRTPEDSRMKFRMLSHLPDMRPIRCPEQLTPVLLGETEGQVRV